MGAPGSLDGLAHMHTPPSVGHTVSIQVTMTDRNHFICYQLIVQSGRDETVPLLYLGSAADKP